MVVERHTLRRSPSMSFARKGGWSAACPQPEEQARLVPTGHVAARAEGGQAGRRGIWAGKQKRTARPVPIRRGCSRAPKHRSSHRTCAPPRFPATCSTACPPAHRGVTGQARDRRGGPQRCRRGSAAHVLQPVARSPPEAACNTLENRRTSGHGGKDAPSRACVLASAIRFMYFEQPRSPTRIRLSAATKMFFGFKSRCSTLFSCKYWRLATCV